MLRDQRPPGPAPAPRRALALPLAIAALALAYIFAGKVGLALASINPSASAVWAPTGLALAAVLVLGRRVWPGVFLGAFVVNVTTAGTVLTSLGIATGNTLEALVGAWLVLRFARGLRCFDRAQDVFRFAFLAGLLATMVSATIGVGSLLLGGFVQPGSASAVWTTWWLGDAVGALVVAPLLILLADSSRPHLTRREAGEAFLLGAGLVGLSQLVFGGGLPAGVPNTLAFLCVPPIVLAAFRFGPRAAAAAAAATSGIALLGTLRGFGPFAGHSQNESLLLLQAFTAVVAMTALPLAAVVDERRRVELALRDARDDLEARVAERTASLVAALQALREAEAIANFGSWEWDIATDRVTWSAGMYRVYGLREGSRPASFEGFLAGVHPEDRDAVRRTIEAASQRHGSFEVEHRIVRPDGAVRTIHARGQVFVDAGGKLLRMSGTGQDITERKEAEKALAQVQELERLKGLDELRTRFLNTAAHELGTPLTPILLQLQILRAAPAEDFRPEHRRALTIVQRNFERLANLVRDTLEAARLQAGHLRMTPTHLELADVVAEQLESFQEPARLSEILLELHAEPGVVVEGDPARLGQVVLNLLSNAWKFTPPGGHIAVSVAREGSEAVVRVSDSGQGLRAEDIAKLFLPFSQVHDLRQTKHGGTGLGLFICKGIIDLHQGRIWAESGGLGQGSTFAFAVPLAAVHVPSQAQVQAEALAPAQAHAQVQPQVQPQTGGGQDASLPTGARTASDDPSAHTGAKR